jgi:hypothetical protein
MTLSLQRLARNQAIFREVNERLREIADPAEGLTDYLCECSDVGCRETMQLATIEYEAVRSMPNTFVIVPGHERLEVERVIDDNDRFMLVEKTIPIDNVDLDAVYGRYPWPSHGL